MRGQEHVAVAVLPAFAVLLLLNGTESGVSGATWAAVPAAAALGGLMPDIDHPRSLIGKGLPAELIGRGASLLLLVGVAAWALSKYAGQEAAEALVQPLLPMIGWFAMALAAGFALLAASLVASRLFEHRGPTHSLAFALVGTVVLAVILAASQLPWAYALVLGWGYLSHLATDLATPTGCPCLLWPLRRSAR
jgi:membrane-bound metal-dependent hydrolase YbcI (DUF457 family)